MKGDKRIRMWERDLKVEGGQGSPLSKKGSYGWMGKRFLLRSRREG